MSELFEYGIQIKKYTSTFIPNNDVPPIATLKSGLEKIYFKIKVVLDQLTGTVFYNRNLGCNIDESIFEDDTEENKERLKHIILEALHANVHDVTITEIQIESESLSDGSVQYNVTITVKYDEEIYDLEYQVGSNS